MLKKLGYIFNRGQKLHLLVLLCVFIVGGFLELIGVSAILPLVNVIMDTDAIHTNPYYALVAEWLHITDASQFVILICVALIAIYIFKNLYSVLSTYLQFRFTYNNNARMSYDLLNTYMRQDYLYLVDHNVSDLQRNITGDVNTFFTLVLGLLNVISELCIAALLVAYLMLMSWETTLGLIAFVLLIGSGFLVIYRKKLHVTGEKLRELGAQRWKCISQSFGGIKATKVLGREAYFTQSFWDVAFDTARVQQAQGLYTVITRPVMEAICICGVLAIVAIQIAAGVPMQNFISILSVFAIAAMRLLPSCYRIMGSISGIVAAKPSLDALYEDLQETRRLDAQHQNRQNKQGAITLEKQITVDHVTFRYPSAPADVLRNISLVIPKNKSVALIGPSGAGKTTLADSILGLMEPQQGRILADDTDVYASLDAWHKVIGYIPQNIYLMDDTIRANICFGVPEQEIDEQRVWEALKQAQLDGFVKSLPKGLKTMTGDLGAKLSGGQRQRIGIARALYHDPAVLVLDEATSALDTDTENAVMQAINSLQGNKTLIIIAHRLSTIRNCDLIYEVRDGGVTPKSPQEVFGAR